MRPGGKLPRDCLSAASGDLGMPSACSGKIRGGGSRGAAGASLGEGGRDGSAIFTSILKKRTNLKYGSQFRKIETLF